MKIISAINIITDLISHELISNKLYKKYLVLVIPELTEFPANEPTKRSSAEFRFLQDHCPPNSVKALKEKPYIKHLFAYI